VNHKLREMLKNGIVHPKVDEFLTFAISDALIAFHNHSETSKFTELSSELEALNNQLSKTATVLNNLSHGAFNWGTPDLYSRVCSLYSESLGDRFGDKDTRKACDDFFIHLQVHGPKLLSFVLDSCKTVIESNIKNGDIASLKGVNIETKRTRQLIARIAGIYNILGGKDSYSETSNFVSIIAVLFTDLGIDKDPSATIKRAKEQDYYERIKNYISGHPSYDLYKYYFNNHPDFKNKLSENK
jgi:hypothetical protein